MKSARNILGFLLASGICAPLAAQTLEESYAKLCSGAGKNSESCQVLRKALQAKLAAEDEPSTEANARSAGQVAKPAVASAARWGFWAALPDSGAFYAPGSIVTYR